MAAMCPGGDELKVSTPLPCRVIKLYWNNRGTQLTICVNLILLRLELSYFYPVLCDGVKIYHPGFQYQTI